MTMLAAASHIILEVRENTGKKKRMCYQNKINYTDDYGNLNLHKQRLLLLVKNPDGVIEQEMELEKRNQSFTLLAGTRTHTRSHDIRVPVQKCL